MPSRTVADTIAQRLRVQIASGDKIEGARLGTQEMANALGVSRTPVRMALEILAAQSLLVRQPRRGFFVKDGARARAQKLNLKAAKQNRTTDPYMLLVDDWLNDQIPAEVTESELLLRYQWPRSILSDVLLRAVREGWVERKEGYGWRFLDVAKSPDAFEQVYRFRAVIEPAALLEPTFKPDHEKLARLRAAQQRLLTEDIDDLPAEVLLTSGADFHEAMAEMSGNPFFHAALVRANRMRRLMEYRTKLDHQRVMAQCREHLQILEHIERGNLIDASFVMRAHLSGALDHKSPVDWKFSSKE